MTYKVAMILLLYLISNQEGLLKLFMDVFYCNLLISYGRPNMTEKWQKQCFFFQIFTMDYQLLVEVAKIL